VRGQLPARGTPHPAFGHPLPQGERDNGTGLNTAHFFYSGNGLPLVSGQNQMKAMPTT